MPFCLASSQVCRDPSTCAVANLVISEEDKARINATSGKQRQHDKDRFFAFNYNPGNLEFKENK